MFAIKVYVKDANAIEHVFKLTTVDISLIQNKKSWIIQEIAERLPQLANISPEYMKLSWRDADDDKISICNEKDFNQFLLEGTTPNQFAKVYLDVIGKPPKTTSAGAAAASAASSNAGNAFAFSFPPANGVIDCDLFLGPINPPVNVNPTTTAPPSANDGVAANHCGVVCDSCDKQIIGYRYKCLQCPDFDLCHTCESNGHHSHHLMVRLAKPMDGHTAIFRVLRNVMRGVEEFNGRQETKCLRAAFKEQRKECRRDEKRRRHDDREERSRARKDHVSGTRRCGVGAGGNPIDTLTSILRQFQSNAAPVTAAASAATATAGAAGPGGDTSNHGNNPTNDAQLNQNVENYIKQALALASTAVAGTCNGLIDILDPLRTVNDPQSGTPRGNPPPYTPDAPPAAAATATNTAAASADNQDTEMTDATTKKKAAAAPTASTQQMPTEKPTETVTLEDVSDDDDDDVDGADKSSIESFNVLEDPEGRADSRSGLNWLVVDENGQCFAEVRHPSRIDNTGAIPKATTSTNVTVPPQTVEVGTSIMDADIQKLADTLKELNKEKPTAPAATSTHVHSQTDPMPTATTEIYPVLENVHIQDVTYHPNPAIDKAVKTMMAMGFSNRTGYITKLMCEVDGDISRAFDILQANKII